jgi:AraC-like DNA-binding protein
MSSRLDSVTDWGERAKRAKYRVAALAKDCGVSERQLRRFFSSRFECPPHSWIVARRFELIRPLLSEGQLVKEVAAKAGFSRVSSFSRRFKQHFQVPPSKLREPLHEVMERPILL